MAQHAFIKAVEADDTTPTPWSNLGTLYFMLRNVKLANNAFKCAQRVEPAFRQSWIGQVSFKSNYLLEMNTELNLQQQQKQQTLLLIC